MTDEQIKELFDTVPAVADSCIESLRPAPFLRSISRCLSASVNTGLIYGTVNPNYPGMTWRELLDKGEKMRKNIRLFTVNPEWNTLRFENHRRKGFNADFQAEELEEGLLPALLNPFKRRFGTYRNLLN